ncbi:unnamed protein product [Rotaria sordida]|uniref:Uncharacterized protein n=1 Tax=Rotaria sordida TaxID=392033 RepID=A0A816CJ41_9BILA|nr:unnamed protein product [Rotaria sordida]
MSIFGVVWLLIEVNLIGGTIFGFPALFKILPQYGIYANKYTFAFNLSTISAILICSLNGFLLEFKADKSKKQKLLNISLMQTISWLINIVTCIICMFVQKGMIISALIINCFA